MQASLAADLQTNIGRPGALLKGRPRAPRQRPKRRALLPSTARAPSAEPFSQAQLRAPNAARTVALRPTAAPPPSSLIIDALQHRLDLGRHRILEAAPAGPDPEPNILLRRATALVRRPPLVSECWVQARAPRAAPILNAVLALLGKRSHLHRAAGAALWDLPPLGLGIGNHPTDPYPHTTSTY